MCNCRISLSELEAVAHWNPEHVSMLLCTYFNFPNSEKWSTVICQILLLWVPFRFPPEGSRIWLCKEQVEHLVAKRKIIFLKTLLLTWCFLRNSEACITFPINSRTVSSLPCAGGLGRPYGIWHVWHTMDDFYFWLLGKTKKIKNS